MKKEYLIGKKVKGFKFRSGKHHDLFYNRSMNKFIGETGEIKSYSLYDDSYNVQYKRDDWCYPAELIENHLVDPTHPLIITKQTKVRAGKKYYTWKFSKNMKTSNHMYNQPGTRNKQLTQFLEDIKSGNYEIK